MSKTDTNKQNTKPRIPKFVIAALLLIVVCLLFKLVKTGTAAFCVLVLGIGWIIMKMNERDSNVRGPKPKTSVLAITSIVVPVVVFVGWSCHILLLRNPNFDNFMGRFLLILLLATFLLPLAPILGISALIKITKSRGLLKGYIFSILGILMSILVFVFGVARGLASTRSEASIRLSQSEMIQIYKAMQAYSNDYANQYPTANKWCNLLVEYIDEEETQFLCYSLRQGQCYYAINPNVNSNSSLDMVLLFETKWGWNQYGGPEILTLEKHYRKGCNILFNDGHVEFAKPKKLGELKWKVEESNSVGKGFFK